MLIESRRHSDGCEINSGETANSSHSSISSETCSSNSRFSFDLLELPSARLEALDEKRMTKPHRSSDLAFSNIHYKPTGFIFRDFRLIRQIGSGDISTVYLCQLRSDDSCFYAMKVVDKEALALKKKVRRAEMEKKILMMLDHPFLPSVYAQFEASHFSCIVMEFCAGGDLHSLRHKQPHRRFPLRSARFYAAEVLVALEYLHMLGIIYRDLKPENVMVRSDGHIMLSDFDLSLCSIAIPAVHSPSLTTSSDPPSSPAAASSSSSRAPSLFSCFPGRGRRIQTLPSDRLFVAEPVGARSCSFVGTHEYVAPEVASGGSHGNAVDWWAFGIFLYEMIYGRTPFAGASNEVTLRSIVKKPLRFPADSNVSAMELHARDLISGLLVKDPGSRLGSKRGAAEVKTHAFFRGLNFALIRTMDPPAVPDLRREKTTSLGAFDCF